MNWKDHYRSRTVSPREAVTHIKSGDRVVLGHACAEPPLLVAAMVDRADELTDVEIVHMLPMGSSIYCGEEFENSFRHNSLFAGRVTRDAINEERADYTPCFFHQIPSLFKDNILPVDVSLISVSPPDEEGMVSLGVSVDYTKQAALSSKIVIAEVNRNMPRTGGDSFVSVHDIDFFVKSNEPLIEVPSLEGSDTDIRIARHVSQIINDGDCLQIGIGAIPDAVVNLLTDKNDLGIHSEMLPESVIELVDSGVINCSKKNFLPGKIVFNLAMGTKRFYDWLDDNPLIAMFPVDFTNNPFIIGKNDNMVTINSAISVDILGQVAADTIGSRQYSGVGGQVDFTRGASHSRGGRNIIALPSTAAGGKISRIVSSLSRGQAVTTSRHDVDYIATEHGIVRLKGKTLKQRCEALISISEPRFRDQLIDECRELYGISNLDYLRIKEAS